MYFKLCIAVMATAITMSSCEWLFPKKDAAAQYSLEGKWRIDSIAPDSAGLGFVFASLAMGNNDSSHHQEASEIIYHFTNGKVISTVDDLPIDSSDYEFDSKKLAIKTKHEEQDFSFEAIIDSSFKITGNDSVIIFYEKAK